MAKLYNLKTLKGLITIFLLVLLISEGNAQNEVAIGSSTTKSNAILWLNGNGGQGLILPVVTSKTAVSGPDKGMIVYDNSDNKVWYRSDNAWVEVAGGGASATSLNLNIVGNELQLLNGTTVQSKVNIAGGAPVSGAFMGWNGSSWQYTTISDIGGGQVIGIKGKTIPTLPTTTQALVYDGTAWKFQPLSSSDSQTLTFTSPNLSISNGNSVNLSALDKDAQTLTLTGSNLSISGGNSVTLPTSTGVTSVTAGTGLTGGTITTTGTINVDVGTTANKIVQLDANGKLPSVDGSQLTNLPAFVEVGDISDVVAGSGLTGGGTTGSVTLGLANSGVTAGVYGSATAVPQMTVDAFGRITAVTTFPPLVADGSITGGTAGTGVKIAANTITDANILSLNASKITSGTLPAAQVPSLDASKITTGTFTTSQIPNLDAAKITTGSFNTAQIPNLDASKITSGTFNTAQIPNLDAAKITSGIIPTTQGGTGLGVSAGSIGNGELLIGANPGFVKANLTAGSGINITNGAGSITISSTATGTVSNVTGTAPISVANGTTTPVISITQAGSTTNGFLSSADWNVFNSKQGALTLTTTGTNGAATLTGSTLNIPQYSNAAGTGLTLTGNTFSVNTSQNISTLSNLTSNGLIKTSGGTGALSIATVGTDYAPATSGTAILKGNGTGGFSNAVSGTDYAPATTGSSLLKGNGAGGFSNATAGTDYLVPNAAITGATATKITYDSKGLVTSGTTLVASDLPNTAVTPATYGTTTTIPQIAVDQQGRITSASNLTIPTATGSVSGLLSSADWTAFSSKQGALTLTTTGTTGPASLTGSTLNIPQYSNAAGTGLTLTGNTFSVNTSQNISTLSNLTTKGLVTTTGAGLLGTAQGTGFLKDDGTGTITYDNSTYLTSYTETDPAVKAINGIVKSSAGVLSAAAAGTDYAPATAGTAVLKGNGAGGFSNAVSGTDYAPATTGSSLLKGNGAGGFTNAAAGTDYLGTTLTSANILVGSGTNVATGVALSGDATLSNAGVLTIADGAISGGTGGKIADGTITSADLAPGAVTASNGLTASNNNVALGGTLSAFTTVDLNSNELNFNSATNGVVKFNLQGINSDFFVLGDQPTKYWFMVDGINGRVGINTPNPAAQLDIAGQIKITDGTQGAGKVLTSDANGLASWQAAGSGWNLTGNPSTDPANNFIGTTDATDFVVRTTNTERLRVKASGQIWTQTNPFPQTVTTSTALPLLELYKGAAEATTARIIGLSTQSQILNLLGQNSSTGAIQGWSFIRSSNENLILTNNSATGINSAINSNHAMIIDGTTQNVWIGSASGLPDATAKLTIDGQVKINGGTPGAGKVLTSDASGLATWQTSSGLSNPMTTLGDIIYGGASGTPTRLAAGTANFVLTSNGPGTAPTWSAPSAVSGWATNGNAITSGNFIGTTNNLPLEFRVNNTKSGYISIDPGGTGNTSFGYGTLSSGSLTGTNNTAMGNNAMLANTSGIENTAVGLNALTSNTTASQNTAIGKSALWVLTGGVGANTAVGYHTLYQTTSGNNNTALGYLSGTTGGSVVGNTTGNSNTYIGANSGPTANNLSNATTLGAGATVNASNKIRLGNASVTVIEGQVAFTAASDRRLKHNIKALDLGMDFIKNLKPVSYQLNKSDDRENWGFIAQDIEALVGVDKAVLTIGQDSMRSLGLRYTDFIAPMVKAMQEQQLEIEQLKAKLKAKNDEVSSLETSVTAMKDELEEIKRILGMEAKAKTADKKLK